MNAQKIDLFRIKSLHKKFRNNYQLALKYKDPEDLHQLRVGLRKIITILEFLKLGEKRGNSSNVLNDLYKKSKRIQKRLGRIRDYDIFISKTGDVLKSLKVLKENKKFKKDIFKTIKYERELVRKKSKSKLSNNFMRNYNSQSNNLYNKKKMLMVSCSVIDEKFKSLHDKFEELSGQYNSLLELNGIKHLETQRAFHKVRLQAKHLRYAYEYLGFALLGSTKSRIKFFRKIQKNFGEINDWLNLNVLVTRLMDWHDYLDKEACQSILIEINDKINKGLEKINLDEIPERLRCKKVDEIKKKTIMATPTSLNSGISDDSKTVSH